MRERTVHRTNREVQKQESKNSQHSTSDVKILGQTLERGKLEIA